MTQALEQLARQERTLAGIRGIVRTMKTLAAVNAAPYEQAAAAIGDYQRTIRAGFSAFAWRMGEQALPAGNTVQRQVLVAFGSDHGFCGNYNETLAQAVHDFLARLGALPRSVICIGARLQEALAEHGVAAAHRLMPPASAGGIGRLASEVVALVERCGGDTPLASLAVHLAYTQRAAAADRSASVVPLLPLERALREPPVRWPERSLPDFSMEPAALLAALLRNLVFASVYQAAAEAMVTENAARLALMQQAEQSVDERLETVRRALAGARQDKVTEELMDIVIAHVQ